MLIGHSMDIVNMPKVPRHRATFAKMRSIQSVDNISVQLGVAIGSGRGFTAFSDLKKMAENMQLKSVKSRYK
jgi:hypothetical protein